MTPLEREELDRFLDENLASKRIKPSKSPYAALCFSYQKKTNCYVYVRITES
jgi:hypothetical protein